MTRSLDCDSVERTCAFDAPFERCNFGAETFFFLVVLVVFAGVLADDFAAAATRLDFGWAALVFATGLRLETLAVFVALAASFFVDRAGLLILAETFASLLLLVALDFGDRLIAFADRLDDFFGAFFRVDMADLLLTPSEPSAR